MQSFKVSVQKQKHCHLEKGNTIVILDKISYISAIEGILNDHTKNFNLDIHAGKEINYIANLDKRINHI